MLSLSWSTTWVSSSQHQVGDFFWKIVIYKNPLVVPNKASAKVLVRKDFWAIPKWFFLRERKKNFWLITSLHMNYALTSHNYFVQHWTTRFTRIILVNWNWCLIMNTSLHCLDVFVHLDCELINGHDVIFQWLVGTKFEP